MAQPHDRGPDFLERFVELLEGDEAFCLATVIRSDKPGMPAGSKAICLRDGGVEEFGFGDPARTLRSQADRALHEGRPRTIVWPDGVEVFLEVQRPPARLLICGAGHIALPLSRYAADAGFRVTVLDDRPEYASAARFPDADVVAEDFIPALRALAPRRFRHVVVITRGHAHDLDCLGEVLHWTTDYVGQIGSRRRLAFIKEELARRGFPADALRHRLYGPIGLDIGAESPEEIALAIAAELVCVRRLGAAHAFSLRGRSRAEAP